jgi:hypothetical protein
VSIGGGGWYGSIVGNTVSNGGGTTMHDDRVLASNLLSLSSFYPASFSWTKY